MGEEIFLALDIGTSNIKCGCLTLSADILVEKKEKFPLVQFGESFEIDVIVFFDLIKDLVGQCLSEIQDRTKKVKALLITSQANTFVPVAKDFKPLRKGIVWLDERAKAEADCLGVKLPGYATYSGFGKPLSGLLASKLLWLKANDPQVFNNAEFFPLINEYLVYRLTHSFYTDTTSFGMSGMYDFVNRDINGRLLQILQLEKSNFPQIANAAEKSALISEEVSKEWKIQHRFPVYLCGNDQCASASGAGLKDHGDITINFGSALVLFSITKSISKNMGIDQIAGKYPVSHDYFLLSYEPDFGLVIRSLKEKLFKEGSYDLLFQTYLDYPDVAKITPRLSEMQLDFKTNESAGQFCAGIIKYYIDQLKKHIADVNQRERIKNIFLSGAITKSSVWIQIIKKEVSSKAVINNQENAGLMGALNIYLSKN
ncbi:FGGY family carbohydrate kinase [Maribacter sp. X9]|uniref:FGGY family carbohydrate kinase n=1 Tax=Maribacter sp. X9 TaxID=3402159 RepID=UPI003AF3D3CA